MRWMVPLAMVLAGCPAEEEAPTSPCSAGFAADFETNAAFETLMAAPVTSEGGASPHGEMQIWYSTDLVDQIEAGGAFTAAAGATAIKMQTQGESMNITVMVKEDAGFDAANGDWCYEYRGADGTYESSPTSCAGCHNAFTDTDHLGGTEVE